MASSRDNHLRGSGPQETDQTLEVLVATRSHHWSNYRDESLGSAFPETWRRCRIDRFASAASDAQKAGPPAQLVARPQLVEKDSSRGLDPVLGSRSADGHLDCELVTENARCLVPKFPFVRSQRVLFHARDYCIRLPE